jgi:hypothetical protein
VGGLKGHQQYLSNDGVEVGGGAAWEIVMGRG